MALQRVLDFKLTVQVVMTPNNVCDRKLNSPFDPRNVTQKKNQVLFINIVSSSTSVRGTNFSSVALLKAVVCILV